MAVNDYSVVEIEMMLLANQIVSNDVNANNGQRQRKARRKKYHLRPRFVKKYLTRLQARIAAAKAFTRVKIRVRRSMYIRDRPYTRTECRNLSELIRKRNGYCFINGVRLWKLLEKKKLFSRRTFRSLKNQFVCQIAPRLLNEAGEKSTATGGLRKLKKGLAMKAKTANQRCPKRIFEQQ